MKKKLHTLYFSLFLFIITIIFPSSVIAQCAGSSISTGLGCIPTEPTTLVRWVLKYGIIAGGGIAFLLSIWGAFTILLAAGNPEKINEGKQIITSAISGLLFILFSVFLLRFIGVDILQIPGLTK